LDAFQPANSSFQGPTILFADQETPVGGLGFAPGSLVNLYLAQYFRPPLPNSLMAVLVGGVGSCRYQELNPAEKLALSWRHIL
jgi:hypothetical protein